jgi:hypothetical protein
MSSVVTSPRTSNGYFVVLGTNAMAGKVFSYTGGSGAGGSFVPGSFAAATWAATGPPATLLAISGAVLRDNGKTVVSAGRVFRKVSLYTPSLTTGGVSGGVFSPAGQQDYHTGYIELPGGSLDTVFAGAVTPDIAPVAYMPRFAF